MNISPTFRERELTDAPTHRRPFVQEIGDDHPDQPTFTGGVLVLALVAALSWVAIGAIFLIFW